MPVPKYIGRYPVKRLLGSGAMGSVYLARDTELDRPVAIKTVHSRLVEHANAADILERLRNEARAVARVKHPSIVEVYDVGKDAEVGPFLVFEYVEGRNLKQLLADSGPLPSKLVLALAGQVGEALARAHAAGIIHRDIKPENLLVGEDGRTRLLDFGVARLPDAVLTGEGQFLGTPAYSAPETLSRGAYSPASDQFSLAAVLFEAVAGRRAFVGDDALAVAHAVIHDEAPAPSEVVPRGTQVPEEVDAVILRGLDKSEAERFGSVPALVAALAEAYGDTAPTAPEALADTLPQRAVLAYAAQERDGGRGRRWAWLATGALALGLGSLIVLRFVPSAAEGAEGSPVTPSKAAVPATPKEELSDAGTASDASTDGAAQADAEAEVEASVLELTAFEREERAKDALDRARGAIDRGDSQAASEALDEAARYDPEHPDIPVLRRRADLR